MSDTSREKPPAGKRQAWHGEPGDVREKCYEGMEDRRGTMTPEAAVAWVMSSESGPGRGLVS